MVLKVIWGCGSYKVMTAPQSIFFLVDVVLQGGCADFDREKNSIVVQIARMVIKLWHCEVARMLLILLVFKKS